MYFFMSLFLRIAVDLAIAEGLRAHGHAAFSAGASTSEEYTFDAFVQDFAREYKGSDEYERRAALFRDSLSQIAAINSRAGGSWTAGVYPFMDWSAAERSDRLHGLVPSASRRAAEPSPLAALQEDSAARGRLYGGAGDSFEAVAPAVQDQNIFGDCGSCWAFAAVEAVEAQLMKNKSPLLPDGEPRLSVQALLDCVPQQNSCAGGCKGSHPDLAFAFMRRNGLPLETAVPYDPMHTGKCPIEPYPQDWVRVTITGWQELPSNQAQPLMRALVQNGPAVVSADSRSWYPYKSGVFNGCPKDPDPNHSVLARGYGIEGGNKYWLLQNSWGTQWGEAGSIRIARHDDENSWCGTAWNQDGEGCDSEQKTNVTVCGSCGFLGYGALVPKVGYVMLGPGPSGSEIESAGSDFDAPASVDLPASSTKPASVHEADDYQQETVQSGPIRIGAMEDLSTAPLRVDAFNVHSAQVVQPPLSSQQPAGSEPGHQYVLYGEMPSVESVAVRDHIDLSSMKGRQLLSRRLTDAGTKDVEPLEGTHAAISSSRVPEPSLSDVLPATEGEDMSGGDFFLGDYLRR